MQNRIIIAFFIGLLFISFSFLAYTETKKRDINSQDLWFVYFNNLKDKSLDFSIENHSNNNTFQFEIFSDKEKIVENKIEIKKGESYIKKINSSELYKNKKITIKVISGDKSKEIYKNL